MNIKRYIYIVLIFLVLVSLSAVSAADDSASDIISAEEEELILDEAIDEDVSSANDNYDDELILEDNSDDDFVGSADEDQTPKDILSVDTSTYSELANEIGSGGNIVLQHEYYTYDSGYNITISTPNSVIDGKGAVIDMDGSNIRAFLVTASGVTIKNLTIKNVNLESDGGAIYFVHTGTVENCNFINNSASGDDACGGAIACEFLNYEKITVTNCNFTNNTASHHGGAIFMYWGSVTNCNFNDNKITAGYGGAVYFSDSAYVTNCNFNNNNAENPEGGSFGGAVYIGDGGSVSNSNFTNNSALYGGAIIFSYNFNGEGNVINCHFAENFGIEGGAINMGPGTVANCNFTDNKANAGDGGAIRMSSGTVTDCNFIKNYAFGFGGAVYLRSDSIVTNCNFTENSAIYSGAVFFRTKGNVTNCNFNNNNATNYGAIRFNEESNVTNCNFNNNNATDDGGAIHFLDGGEVTDCNFNNNTAGGDGGAILGSGSVTDCNFINNTAGGDGGAIRSGGPSTLTNCNFTDNTAAGDGGAVWMYSGDVMDCNFIGNNATAGSAICFYSSSWSRTVYNSCFLNNRANAEALDIVKNENNITITFTGRNNILNAIYARNDTDIYFNAVELKNVTYWGADGIANTGSSIIEILKSSLSNRAAGQNITVGIIIDDVIVLEKVYVTDENGTIVLDMSVGDNYFIGACHVMDSYYTEAEKYISENINFNVNVTSQTTNNKTVNITAKSNILNDAIQGQLIFILPNGEEISANYNANGTWWATYEFDDYGDYEVKASYIGLDDVSIKNATISIRNIVPISVKDVNVVIGDDANVVVSVPAAINGQVITITVNGISIDATVNDGKANATFDGLPIGEYVIDVEYLGDGRNSANSTTAKLTVDKIKTELTASAVTTTYNDGKNIVITLKDSEGNPVSGVSVTVDLNGAKKYTTDKNGQVKVAVGKLVPKTYTAKIRFAGNDLYKEFSTTVKVTVKKATPKLTAKAKTFKFEIKTKKYTVTLKDNKGKALKNKKVTLKVKGKTYTAKTNSKGVATFKLTKLNKKGKFNAVITYAGDKYYSKVTKKTKLTVKAPVKKTKKAKESKKSKSSWKTVSKGSKDKATVKKIQKALKNNGYYLSYQGHYLKIDGIYHDCTVRSVKQFQKAKGLKVTGKVDEKTAKKLKLI